VEWKEEGERRDVELGIGLVVAETGRRGREFYRVLGEFYRVLMVGR